MREIGDISSIKELGLFLKTSREDKGISLEQVHSITNIRTKYLVAIEVGDLSQIPGGEVYIRGFLRNYARAIELDADETLSIYKTLQKDIPKNSEPVKVPRVENIEGKRIPVGIKLKIASVVLVLVVLTFSFSLFRGAFKPEPTPDQNDLVTPPPVEDSDALLDVEKTPIDTDQDIVEEALIVLAHADASKNLYLVDDDDLTVSLEVLQDRCWMSSSLDGVPDFEGTLSQGEMQTFKANSNITIRIGNPQVVKLIVNHQDLGVPGGASRNFIFERSN